MDAKSWNLFITMPEPVSWRVILVPMTSALQLKEYCVSVSPCATVGSLLNSVARVIDASPDVAHHTLTAAALQNADGCAFRKLQVLEDNTAVARSWCVLFAWDHPDP